MAIQQEKRPYKHQFLFDKRNFKFVGIGIGLMVLGFVLMIGGKTTDPNVYNPEELYSFRRITLAPILIIAGLIVQIYAILLKPNTVEKKLEDIIEQKDKTAESTHTTETHSHLTKTFQTGQKCKIAGTYFCKTQPEQVIKLNKGTKFPKLKKTGKNVTWVLQDNQ